MAESAHRSCIDQALSLGDQLPTIGQQLAAAGLSERAVQHCFGVHCVAHAPLRTAAMTPPDAPTLAAVLPWLFAASKPLPTDAVRAGLGDELFDTLCGVELLREQGNFAWAEACLLPVGEALSVSDRIGRKAAPVPDDSAFHLIGALPQRRVDAWLDVGTGNAIAPLARRGLAARVLGTDINRPALACARLGVALSSADEIELREADLFDGITERWPLLTFNAPIPGWRDTLLDRFWSEVRDRVSPDGEVIVHSRQADDGYPAALELPGEVIVARYTPPGSKHAFGVTCWRPGRPARAELRQVELTTSAPHVTRDHVEC